MTTRFRYLLLLCTAALLAVAGVLFGLLEALALAAGAVAVLVASTVRSFAARPDLEIRRVTTPSRCSVGERCIVELRVTNRSRRPSPAVRVTDTLDDSVETTVRLAPLAPFATETSTYLAPTERRGLVRLGPLRAATIDPFGLTERRVACETPESVVAVWPESWLLDGVDATGDNSGGERQVPLDSAQHFGRGDEFASLHEYTPGDDVRQIHWPSTARLGRPIIRRNEPPDGLRLTIIVDARISLGDRQAFERTLSVAASLIRSAADRVITVLVVGGDPSPAAVTELGARATPGAGGSNAEAGAARTGYLLDHLCVLEQTTPAVGSTGRRPPTVLNISSWTGDEVVLVTPRAFANINNPDDPILLGAEWSAAGTVVSTSSSPGPSSPSPMPSPMHGGNAAPSWLARFGTMHWDGTEALPTVWDGTGLGGLRAVSLASGRVSMGFPGR